jgi:regulatory protein YycI of two-component signal transduction system YycFG
MENEKLLEKVKDFKHKLTRLQDYEGACIFRDLERTLMIDSDSEDNIESFLETVVSLSNRKKKSDELLSKSLDAMQMVGKRDLTSTEIAALKKEIKSHLNI